jgi:GGDEF domain-containing protein
MSSIEVSIWAAMLGAVLVFLAASVSEAAQHNNLAAWRGLVLVVLTGGSSVLMSGLPEHLAGWSEQPQLSLVKITLTPLSGGLALFYLGHWLGRASDGDESMRIAVWGSVLMCSVAWVLLIWVWFSPQHAALGLQISALTSVGGALMAVAITVRAMLRGDRLAITMVWACVCLTLMVALLYAKGLALSSSNWLWALAACMTAGFFMLSTTASIQRNRQQRYLAKMAAGISQSDEVTGLPVGAHLLSKIDDAIWRSSRASKDSAIIAIWVDNLYELSESLDHSVEQEIRHILTARIRRVLGFQHVLGLQENRCFVIAVSRLSSQLRVMNSSKKLYASLILPMRVGVLLGQAHEFTPSIGIGLIFVNLHSEKRSLDVIDQAQQLARVAKDGVQTTTIE